MIVATGPGETWREHTLVRFSMPWLHEEQGAQRMSIYLPMWFLRVTSFFIQSSLNSARPEAIH